MNCDTKCLALFFLFLEPVLNTPNPSVLWTF